MVWGPSRLEVWLLPELALFPSGKAGRAAWRQAYRAAYKNWAIYLWIALVCLFFVYFFPVLCSLIPGPESLRVGLIGAAVGAAFYFGLVVFCKRPIQRSLRKQLIELGIPVCTECGYELRGQVEPRCPECGVEFDKTLLEQRSEAKDGSS